MSKPKLTNIGINKFDDKGAFGPIYLWFKDPSPFMWVHKVVGCPRN